MTWRAPERPRACAPGSRRSATARSRAPQPRLLELGLRGIVYLEVFGHDERTRALRGEPRPRRRRVLRPRAAGHLAARAVHVQHRALPRLREARSPARDASPRARRSWPTCGTAAARGRRSPSCSSSRTGARRSRHSQRRACSARRRSRHTACTSGETSWRCCATTTSQSHTARARTRCSAAASRPWASFARRACGSQSRPIARPRLRRSTCSRSSAPRSTPLGRGNGERTH